MNCNSVLDVFDSNHCFFWDRFLMEMFAPTHWSFLIPGYLTRNLLEFSTHKKHFNPNCALPCTLVSSSWRHLKSALLLVLHLLCSLFALQHTLMKGSLSILQFAAAVFWTWAVASCSTFQSGNEYNVLGLQGPSFLPALRFLSKLPIHYPQTICILCVPSSSFQLICQWLWDLIQQWYISPGQQ